MAQNHTNAESLYGNERFDRRTVFLTGAAGGFGRALAIAYLKAGAAVVATDVSSQGLAELHRQLEAVNLAERCLTRVLDISDCAACEAAVAEAQARFGTIDILINNGAVGMGVIRDDHMTNLVTIDEIEPKIWDRFLGVNVPGLTSPMTCTPPAMKAQGWGRIITVTTSFFSMLRGRFHPYGPSKAALEAMSAGHASEFEADGITVNIVVPGGPADTPMVPAAAGYKREDLVSVSKMIPPMFWLCSPAADDVTGNRYIAAHWDESTTVEDARKASQSPIGWPDLAGAPVWPGGKPADE